jgi:thioredoxin-like negative regulator of GroEL
VANHIRFCWVVALGLCSGLPISAAEVEWRTDYASARAEATQKNLPILVEVGTRSCFWCKKMEASTYRDTNVITLLNQQFIPVKIDANREPTLTSNLGVDGFPTAVLASPDGTILDRIEGYLAAGPFVQRLRKVSVASADWPTRALAEANAAWKAGDTVHALGWLKRAQLAPATHPVQAQGRLLLSQIEGQAREKINQAVQLYQQGREGEARQGLTNIVRNYPSTQGADAAQSLMTTWSAQERPVQASYRGGR